MEPRKQTPSIFLRIRWVAIIYGVNVLLRLLALARRIKLPPPSKRVTYRKSYAVRPNLVNHVWIPQSYKPGSSTLLPLLIDIHGGGFCIGHPTVDDVDNAILCHKHGICIVSINYRKAPGSPFPVPVQDAAALIEAVLDDPDLPVDKSKVAICGYSAGGNLALAAPQLNGLHKRIKGVVAFYPAADFSRTLKMRMDVATPPTDREDILIAMSPGFNWAYVPAEQDLQEPTLSPIYASIDVLPRKLYLVGCEYDMLCSEARDMAVNLAKLQRGEGNVSKEELGDGRKGWKCGNVTWEELEGLEHGFNQRYAHEKNKATAEMWKSRADEMHARVAEWLYKEIYTE